MLPILWAIVLLWLRQCAYFLPRRRQDAEGAEGDCICKVFFCVFVLWRWIPPLLWLHQFMAPQCTALLLHYFYFAKVATLYGLHLGIKEMGLTTCYSNVFNEENIKIKSSLGMVCFYNSHTCPEGDRNFFSFPFLSTHFTLVRSVPLTAFLSRR